jgi:hypothetical protein
MLGRPQPALLALSALGLVAACVGAGASPPASPQASPAVGHATGTIQVVLRMATGGGFVAPGALATEVPEFTLYGDGTVVFRDPAEVEHAPVPDDGVTRNARFKTARLTEAEVQELLAFALGPGGLANARDLYSPCCIADAPSTMFTVHAGGLNKQVSVGALDFDEPQAAQDKAARAAFRALAQRLRSLDGGGIPVLDYAPAAYRGILFDGDGRDPALPALDWPWTAFGPDTFSSPTDSYAFPTRRLTSDEVAALKLTGLEGGAQGIALRAPDRKVYLLALRPLLPDETG